MSNQAETETEKKSKPKSEIQFNERSLQAYEKEKVELPYAINASKATLDKFRSKFKPEKGPLQIIIKNMIRQPKTTFDEKGNAVKKDYLTYTTEYHAKDWIGNDLWIREHIHGVYHKPKFKTTTRQDQETGEFIQDKVYDGMTEEHYIELTEKNRKKVIEDIINKSTGSTIDNIVFYGKFPDSALGRAFRCNLYSYDQLINSSIEELEKLGRKEGGPHGNAVTYKDKKPYMG